MTLPVYPPSIAGVAPEDVARFVCKTEIVGNCWQWIKHSEKVNCRPRFKYKGKDWPAARAAYDMFCGVIPTSMFVCHHCDNPCCVRPSHLWLGTAADNMRDRDAKGRGKAYFALPGAVHPRGENNSNAKLTEESIALIISDPRSSYKVAAELGVDQTLVSRIRRGKAWKHISLSLIASKSQGAAS